MLELPAPRRRIAPARAAALACAVALVAIAAAQPAVGSVPVTRVRTDAAVYVLLDTSRSMNASLGPRGETRFHRAIAEAEKLRAELPSVPFGLAGFTDRVVPYLLPSANRDDFDLAAAEAPAIGRPPPRSSGANGTNLEAFSAMSEDSYFPPRTRHKVVVAFTDGESVTFDAPDEGLLLRLAHIRVLVVRTWHAAERIYSPQGRQDPHYRPDPASAAPLAVFARAAGGAVYGEQSLGAVTRAVTHALGDGPARLVRGPRHLTPFAPYLLAAAALPLAFLLLRGRRLSARLTVPAPRLARWASASGRFAKTSSPTSFVAETRATRATWSNTRD